MNDASPAPDPLGDLPARLVLYDGVCGLCNHYVRWLVDRDRPRLLRYAPLQGPTVTALRARHPEIPTTLETIVFVETGTVYLRSDAVLRVAALLPAPWRWLAPLRFVPRPIRDLVYRGVAAQRYRLFGKSDSCRIPVPEEMPLFLE